MESKKIENKIFLVNKVSYHPNQNIRKDIRYVQIKQTKYIKNCCPSTNNQNEVKNSVEETILQIIDISDSILYDEISA